MFKQFDHLPNLKTDLDYDPDSGIFRWRRSGKGRDPGLVAGGKNHYGYIQIYYCGATRQAHRLAWLWVYGILPAERLDHINRIRDDNRIINLRLVSARENALNNARFDSKTPDEIGATYHKKSQRWQAQIRLSGQRVYLGLFATKSEACAVYRTALANSEHAQS